MAPPSYRDIVAPALIDTSIPSTGRAQAAEALASTFRQFSQAGAQLVGELRGAQGRREGAEAGRTDNPAFRQGVSSLTAYGRAYNDAAMRSYAVKSEIAADDAATRLENEAGDDPEHFRIAFGARRDETIKQAPAEARAVLGEVYDRRMAAGMQRLIEKQATAIRNQARADVAEGLARGTDRLAQLRASDDPALQAQAEEEQIKLDMLLDGAIGDGTLSAIEGAALKIDAARSTTTQTVLYRFRNEMDNPYGSPVDFIERLQKHNRTSEALPPAEEEKLVSALLEELRERNALASLRGNLSDNAQKERWAAGNQSATSLLLSGRLTTSTLRGMVDADEIDPDTARSMYNELQSGNDRPDDSKERFRVETTLLSQSEDDIAKNSLLSWDTRRELIAKRRDQVSGWRGTQQAREAADRIDRALGILPGVNPKAMSQDELTKRDKALTEWYNSIDSLPPDKRQGAIISGAEDVINKVIRTQAQASASRIRQRISDLQTRIASGDLDDEEIKEARESLAQYERRLREAEAKAK